MDLSSLQLPVLPEPHAHSTSPTPPDAPRQPLTARAEAKTVRLAITGMNCAGCVATVRSALEKTPGVQQAEVNLATHLATVVGLDQPPPIAPLVKAVQTAGYQAKPVNRSQAGKIDDRKLLAEAQVWRDRTIVAAIGWLVIAFMLPGHTGLHADLAAPDRPFYSPSLLRQLAPILAWGASLLTLVVSGKSFFAGAWNALRTYRPNMDLLIALGASTAFAAGTWQLLTHQPADYLHETATVLGFVCFGSYLEAHGRRQATRSLGQLVQSQTSKVLRKNAQQTWDEIPLDAVQQGETLLVRPGDRIPLDGIVRQGTSSVNEAWLSGESLSQFKQPSSPVLAGSINGEGALEMEVTRPAGTTAWDQTVDLVVTAQASRPRVQRVADQIMAYFVPALLCLAGLTGLAWMLAGQPGRAVQTMVAVVIVTCPCAVGLAAPLAVMQASGKAAREGIIVKDAEVFEVAAGIKTVAFDKTGTLTQGEPQLTRVEALDEIDATQMLQLAASLEQLSQHPLAKGVRLAAQAQGLTLWPADGLEVFPGQGLQGTVYWNQKPVRVVLGTADALAAHATQDAADSSGSTLQNRIIDGLQHAAQSAEVPGERRLHLAVDGRYAGYLCLSDPLAPHTSEAISQLQTAGVRLVLLSGDHPTNVKFVASELGISDATGGLLPAEKLSRLRSLRQAGPLAMVGDGVNDAPALAAADLGIAMGAGADVAQAMAQVVLSGHDLRKVVRLIQLSKRTLLVIWQNFGWALAYNLLMVPLAAWGWIPPWAAAAAMSLSSLSVVLNSQRLRWA